MNFAEKPGLLFVAATLAPLASFVVLLILGGLRFAVRRTRILAMTSPSVVRSTTRSPLRAAELGETIKISPSR